MTSPPDPVDQPSAATSPSLLGEDGIGAGLGDLLPGELLAESDSSWTGALEVVRAASIAKREPHDAHEADPIGPDYELLRLLVGHADIAETLASLMRDARSS
jgi:hypothetical protein